MPSYRGQHKRKHLMSIKYLLKYFTLDHSDGKTDRPSLIVIYGFTESSSIKIPLKLILTSEPIMFSNTVSFHCNSGQMSGVYVANILLSDESYYQIHQKIQITTMLPRS